MFKALVLPLIFGIFIRTHGSPLPDAQSDRQLAELQDRMRKLEQRIEVLQRVLDASAGNTVTLRSENLTLDVGRNATLDINDGMTVKTGQHLNAAIGKDLIVRVRDQITLDVGASSLTMKKNGDIELKGRIIQIDGERTTVKGTQDLIMKGRSIRDN